MSTDSRTRPSGAYEPAVITTGACLHLAGQTARRGEQLVASGIVGATVDLETAQRCARQCVDNLLAHARHELGGDERIKRVASVGVYVAATDNFAAHSAVADAASERFVEALGERGRHARTALGVCSLPRGSPVEVNAVMELAP